ncbi:hypothetical protein V6N13_142296 [Hibiscus sabdariffa]|uniref:PPM-type phosphatase domain-containing protein n=1 Tax=Hibiscus sabdariffa TaxID=183260 RepID=A0ABR2FDR2_9ROSI
MALSVDHKPNQEDEYERIEAIGGKVIQWNEPGDRVTTDEPIAQIETDKTPLNVNSTIRQYVAKEGDIVEPGTRIAIISKSGEGIAAVALTEKKSEKAASEPSSSAETVKDDKPKAKVEASPAVEKPKAPSPPPLKRTVTEPVLPPKERGRRVSPFISVFTQMVPLGKMMLAS